MFKELANLSLKRTAKQAFGFYLAYLVLGAIFSAIGGGLGGLFAGPSGNIYGMGQRGGLLAAIIFVLILNILILKEKKLFKNYLFILIALTSVLITFFLGALIGLIPVAFLTTRTVVEISETKAVDQTPT